MVSQGLTRQVDVVIEVIDLATNKVLVSQRIAEVFNGFVAPAMVAALSLDDDGNTIVHIWQYELRGQQTQ